MIGGQYCGVSYNVHISGVCTPVITTPVLFVSSGGGSSVSPPTIREPD